MGKEENSGCLIVFLLLIVIMCLNQIVKKECQCQCQCCQCCQCCQSQHKTTEETK